MNPLTSSAAPAKNPWEQLPLRAPFVLQEDHADLSAFNGDAPDDLHVHLELLPEPFLGSPDARVVLLGLNPGYKEADRERHREPAFIERSRGNLLHHPADYPFYLLDPNIPTSGWWIRKLDPLINAVGLKVVARSVLCVEYFPYHSRRFRHRRLDLPSQQYSFGLVRQAMERDAVVILLRSEHLWSAAVPELAKYPGKYRVRSVQNPTLSARNCPEGYKRAVDLLKQEGDSLTRPSARSSNAAIRTLPLAPPG